MSLELITFAGTKYMPGLITITAQKQLIVSQDLLFEFGNHDFKFAHLYADKKTKEIGVHLLFEAAPFVIKAHEQRKNKNLRFNFVPIFKFLQIENHVNNTLRFKYKISNQTEHMFLLDGNEIISRFSTTSITQIKRDEKVLKLKKGMR